MTQLQQDRMTEIGRRARQASRLLARLPGPRRDRALLRLACLLRERREEVLAANRQDYEEGQRMGLSPALLDRLLLTPQRLEALAGDVEGVARLPDPLAAMEEVRTLPNGLVLGRKRVPLGVIGAIYESRPNVTVDIASLCIKAGNACILRSGREAMRSSSALARLVQEALAQEGLPPDAVQFVDDPDRSLVDRMLALSEYIDLLIPRGGADFIRYVARHARMPAVTGGVGVVHIYVDRRADLEKAVRIVHNAKVQRPSVCNAVDTVLVHEEVAPAFLPRLAEALAPAGVELRCDRRALTLLGPQPPLKAVPAGPEDWGQEWLSLILSVRVVDSLEEALEHIERYGSGHSEAIVTEDYTAAGRFVDAVDAAAVFVNASTRFHDGGQFGLGAEVAISTSKFHARGPMGLRELTSYKWVVLGSGQIREA